MFQEIDKKKAEIAEHEEKLRNLYFNLGNEFITRDINHPDIKPPIGLIKTREKLNETKDKLNDIKQTELRLTDITNKLNEMQEINKQLDGEFERASFEFTVRLYDTISKSDDSNVSELKPTFKEIIKIDEELKETEDKLLEHENYKPKNIVERIRKKMKKRSLSYQLSKLHKERIKSFTKISESIIKKYASYKDLLKSAQSQAVKKELEKSLTLIEQEKQLRTEKEQLNKRLNILGGNDTNTIEELESEIRELEDHYRDKAEEFGNEIYDLLLSKKNKYGLTGIIKQISHEIGELEQEKFSLLELQRKYRTKNINKRLISLYKIRDTYILEIENIEEKLNQINNEIKELEGKIGAISFDLTGTESKQKAE